MKFLILEDTKSTIDAMNGSFSIRLPEDVNPTIVTSEQEFLNYINSNEKADVYFLDDEVPTKDRGTEFIFKKNYESLIKLHPNAKVFYSGNMPSIDTDAFCEKNNIEMIEKHKIIDKIKEYIK